MTDPLEIAKAALALLEERQGEMLRQLQTLVEMESPSEDKAAVDILGGHLLREFERAGGVVTLRHAVSFGDHLQVDFAAEGAGAKQKPVLLLGHFDTVWELGTLRTMPFKVEKGRVFGPGVYDMKVGIVMMMHAVRALRDANGGKLPRPVRVWLVTDEEVGSESSRAWTEKLAKECSAVFVMEPSQGLSGAVKTARKGVGDYTVRVTGKASHSGVDFEKGESAILELARQIGAIAKFTDLKRGMTVNPGVVRGGTRTNVIAAEAEVDVDVRVAKMADAKLLEKKFRALKPFNKKCKLGVTGGVNRPPMERTDKVVRLYKDAKRIAAALDKKWMLEEKATGGGSDGNFTAALGVPTLDGLGGVGEGAHAIHESIVLAEIPRRTALLAGLIAGISG
jgi:glutamate carboxypeptidase